MCSFPCNFVNIAYYRTCLLHWRQCRPATPLFFKRVTLFFGHLGKILFFYSFFGVILFFTLFFHLGQTFFIFGVAKTPKMGVFLFLPTVFLQNLTYKNLLSASAGQHLNDDILFSCIFHVYFMNIAYSFFLIKSLFFLLIGEWQACNYFIIILCLQLF